MYLTRAYQGHACASMITFTSMLKRQWSASMESPRKWMSGNATELFSTSIDVVREAWFDLRNWNRLLCRLENLDLGFEWPLMSKAPPVCYYLLGPGQCMRTLKQIRIDNFASPHIFEMGEARFLRDLYGAVDSLKHTKWKYLGCQSLQASEACMYVCSVGMTISMCLSSKTVSIALQVNLPILLYHYHCTWSSHNPL